MLRNRTIWNSFHEKCSFLLLTNVCWMRAQSNKCYLLRKYSSQFCKHWTLCQTMETYRWLRQNLSLTKCSQPIQGESVWTKITVSLWTEYWGSRKKDATQSQGTLWRRSGPWAEQGAPAPGCGAETLVLWLHLLLFLCESQRAENKGEGCGGVLERGGVSPVLFAAGWPVVQLAVWTACSVLNACPLWLSSQCLAAVHRCTGLREEGAAIRVPVCNVGNGTQDSRPGLDLLQQRDDGKQWESWVSISSLKQISIMLTPNVRVLVRMKWFRDSISIKYLRLCVCWLHYFNIFSIAAATKAVYTTLTNAFCIIFELLSFWID